MIFDINFWQEIYSSLRKNKIRTILTAFGVFWGIFMLIVLAGAGKGLENNFQAAFAGVAKNSAFVWSDRTGEAYNGYKRGRYWNLTNEDMISIRNSIPEIEYLVPRLNGWSGNQGDNVSNGIKSGRFSLNGDYPDFEKIDPITILKGRFLNDLDIRDKRKVCMIGKRVYEVLFAPNEDPIGQYIKIDGSYYQVIATFTPRTKEGFGGNKNEAIYIPFTTLQVAYNKGNNVDYFAFTVNKGYKVSEIEVKIKDKLKERHQIAPFDNDAVGSFNLEEMYNKFNSLFIGISILTWIVGLGTLLAGVVGVSNIMLVIVKERTHEIGIQRAIGATPRHIITQIMSEAVVLTTVAGYFGLSLGMGLVELVRNALNMSATVTGEDPILLNPGISLQTALITLLILVVSGAVAGLLPALRAVNMKTIDALREEI